MAENQPKPAADTVPTSVSDLLKLYMQQFGSLTFGTVTLIIIWLTMVRPQLEVNQKTLESQREILESLHSLADSLKDSVAHMKSAVELQDRLLGKVQRP